MWIEENDQVFNQEEWLESKVKHVIWNELNLYTKVAWVRVVKLIDISIYLVEGLLKGFDETWDPRGFFVDAP